MYTDPYRNSPLLKMIEQNQKWTDIVNQQQKIIDSMVRPLIEHQEKIDRMIKPLIEAQKINETFKKISQGIIETEEDIKTFKAAIVELGYPPHDTIDIPLLRRIARDYRDNGKEHVQGYIDEFMVTFYDQETIQVIGGRWEEKEHLKKRLPLLKEVIKANELKMYNLIVPALLSQFEGLLIDAFNIKGYVNGTIQTILLDYLLLINKDVDSKSSFNESIHKFYSGNILVNFAHGKTIDSDISRHAILHGADTEFGKETVSLKVILLFDYIINAIEKLDAALIEQAQQAVKSYREKSRRNKKK